MWFAARKSLSLSWSSIFLFNHLRSSALQFFPASEIATASGSYCLIMDCMAMIFSAFVIPPCIFSDCMQNLSLSVDPPWIEYTVEGLMSTSVRCERAMYFAQAVATSEERVPAAARFDSASDVARAWGSWERPIRRTVAGDVGRRARAGMASWCCWRSRRGDSLSAVMRMCLWASHCFAASIVIAGCESMVVVGELLCRAITELGNAKCSVGRGRSRGGALVDFWCREVGYSLPV